MPENRAVVFKRVPLGLPDKGEDLTVEAVPYPDLPPDNGIIVQNLYGSLDPYLRNRMSAREGYMPPFELGKPIANRHIARVIKSNNAKFKEGDEVVGPLPFQEFVAVDGDELASLEHLQNPLGLEDIRVFLGALGMPGLTAYSSLYEIGKPREKETIFISAASGAVGQLVGQLAKHEGLKVIGSVGSDEKLDFIINELGFDGGFNYKKENPAQALQRLAPEGLDIYYDNVGGEHLETSLNAMNPYGRVVVCGLISGYNLTPAEEYPLRNYRLILWRRLTVRGFLVGDKGMGDKYADEHRERLSKWIQDGSFKAINWEVEGIENAADGLIGLFLGHNFGKAVLKY